MNQERNTYNNRYKTAQHRYPNAATRSYKLNKIVDYLLTAATTIGIVVAILFLAAL